MCNRILATLKRLLSKKKHTQTTIYKTVCSDVEGISVRVDNNYQISGRVKAKAPDILDLRPPTSSEETFLNYVS